MSESVSAEQGIVIGELPQELSRLLGHQALGETVQVYLDKMSPAARLNAVNAMAGLITSLETVVELPVEPKGNHTESKMHLVGVTVDGESVLDETSHVAVQEVSPKQDRGDAEIGVGINEMNDAVLEPLTEAGTNSVQVQPIDKKPLKYLYECFDSDVVDRLDRRHISALADSIVAAYRTHFPKASKTGERLHTELIMYLEGKTDEEIAEAVGRSSAAAAQLARSYVFVRLKKKLTKEEFDQMASVVVESEVKPPTIPLVLNETSLQTSTEQTLEGDIADDIQEAKKSGSQIHLVVGDIELLQNQEKTPMEQMYEKASELWGKEIVESLENIFASETKDADPTLAREKLRVIMEKYAPRWFPKLGIGKQNTWNIAANIIGLRNTPTTIAEYTKKHQAKFFLDKTTASEELVKAIIFLLDKELSGAPIVPPAHQATPFLGRRPK